MEANFAKGDGRAAAKSARKATAAAYQANKAAGVAPGQRTPGTSRNVRTAQRNAARR